MYKIRKTSTKVSQKQHCDGRRSDEKMVLLEVFAL